MDGKASGERVDNYRERQPVSPYLYMALEQALVDDASGHVEEARKRYDLLLGTPLATAVAIPSAINLVLLGRFDEAQRAFAVMVGSADRRTAGYAQLWQLWIAMRTYRDDPTTLREYMARATVGLRAADDLQQALLNFYAGQSDVDAVFASADATAPPGSAERRNARTEAALFAGGYLQYARADTAMAQQIYRREFPQSSGSVERSVLQQLIARP